MTPTIEHRLRFAGAVADDPAWEPGPLTPKPRTTIIEWFFHPDDLECPTTRRGEPIEPARTKNFDAWCAWDKAMDEFWSSERITAAVQEHEERTGRRPEARTYGVRLPQEVEEFEVTAADIAAGQPELPASCPVAIAARRAGVPAAKMYRGWIDPDEDEPIPALEFTLPRRILRYGDSEVTWRIPLSDEVANAVTRFDEGRGMDPMTVRAAPHRQEGGLHANVQAAGDGDWCEPER